MKIKKISLFFLPLMSFSALSAETPTADTGLISIKGNVYASSCVISTSTGSALNIAIPTTFASNYTKGDTSPLSTYAVAGSILQMTCPTGAGISIRVDGTADSKASSLYQVTPGTGKAQGVALKLSATSTVGSTNTGAVPLLPNTLSSAVFMPNAVNGYGVSFQAQAVATDDKVVAGDLSTTLTWTAVYN